MEGMSVERWRVEGRGRSVDRLPVSVVPTTGSLLFLNPAVLIAVTTTL